MGAARDASTPAASKTTAPAMHAKKKKSHSASTRKNTDDNVTDASSAVAASTPAAGGHSETPEKDEKKSRKQRRCTEDLQGASSPGATEVPCYSSSESVSVSTGKKRRKQRLDACEPGEDNSNDAADEAVSAAGGIDVAITEREKKRRKREQKAVVEARSSSANNGTSSSISQDTGSYREKDSYSTFNTTSSVSSADSDSSSTCCSSPSAALDRKGTALAAAAAGAKKKRERMKEGSEAEISRVDTTKEVEEDAEKSFVAEPATATAATAPRATAAGEGEQQQGGQLSAYKLTAPTLKVLQQRGIQQLLPIQAATFEAVYSGRDLIGRADTGTGKTLAFALPLVERLLSSTVSNSSRSSSSPSSSGSISGKSEGRGVRLLVLLPTRELAQQVHAEFVLLLQDRLRTACVYGGGSGAAAAGRQQQQYSWQKNTQGSGRLGQLQQQQQQLEDLRRGRCSILVGCPGRVKDVINRGMLQRGAALQSVVLDEADRLLDMGFREDVEEILQWCRDAWKQTHSAAVEREEEEAEERQQNEGKVKVKKSVAAGDLQESRVTSSRSSSDEALQFLLFTATLPHWARSIASRFMRPERLLVDAAALARSSSSGGSSTSSNSSQEQATDAPSSEQQQQRPRGNQGITYLVLFCPWKNRVRVLEDVLTVYGGCAAALAPSAAVASSAVSAVPPSFPSFAAATGGPTSAAGGEGGAVVPGERGNASAVIFAETKQQVNEIALESGLRRLAAPLHGDLPQQQRETTLHAFKSGCFPYLVATDVAARGLHVDSLPLVVQLSPPRDLDSFVHRAGRTGRAGKAGICLTFAATPDIPTLLALEKKLRMQFKRVGVPQPAGIQRRLLDLQLQRILPAAAGESPRSSSGKATTSRDDVATRDEVRDADKNEDGRREKKKAEEEEEEEEQTEGHFSKSDEADAAGRGQFVMEVGGHNGKRTAEEKQIFQAADRVLQALPPHEAVRRCLKLLLRHATAGTPAATAADAHNSTAVASGASSSSSLCAAATADGRAEAAAASGTDRLSCLNGREGFRTYVLRKREQLELQQQQQEHDGGLLQTPGQVWRLLKGALLYQTRGGHSRHGYSERSPAANHVEELLERIHSLTLTADGRGAVFDVAAADIPAFAAHVLRRCGDEPQPADGATTKAAGRRGRGSAAARGGDVTEEGRGAAGAHDEVPFVIREAEELPELVDALALRRSEQGQGGSRSSSQQQHGSGSQFSWHSGRDSSRGRECGGGHSSNGRTWGARGSGFRSASGYSGRSASLHSASSERWTTQQRSGSWTANIYGRGGSSSNSRADGGGRRGRGGTSSTRGGRFTGANRGCRGGLGSGRGRGGQ